MNLVIFNSIYSYPILSICKVIFNSIYSYPILSICNSRHRRALVRIPESIADMQSNKNNTPNLKLREMMPSPIQPRSYYKAYSCSLCEKSFSSPQALGGHKRAHRKEMEEMRTNQAGEPPIQLSGNSVKKNGKEQVVAARNAQENDEVSIDLELSLKPCGVDDHLTLRL
jgi:C2H2-type zinc finger